MLTFFGVLEPFDKLLHLLEKNAFSLGEVGFIVPLQDCLLT